MPPRIHLRGASRLLTIRSRPIMPFQQPSLGALARGLSTETSNTIQPGPSDLLPPSSLQAGKSANLTQAPVVTDPAAAENAEALRQLELMSHGLNPFDPEYDGHKFHMTRTPWEKQMHLKDRYDPLITQLTKLLMWDGKLSKAQRDMAMILNYLRTSPPPKVSLARPLLAGAPPPSHLPLDPILYLTLVIDSVAPLIRVRSFAGLAGGGHALLVPFPLALRQRRRTAFMWIMDAVNKKTSRGSGKTMLAHRIGEEIVAVAEGKSSVWERRQLVHKVGTVNRANLTHHKLKK